MNAIFSQTGYVLKRKGLSLGGKYHLFTLQGDQPLLFIEEKTKWIPPSRTIYAYADEGKKQEVLRLKDSATEDVDMDVIDPESGQKIGGISISAENLSEVFKDAWAILDANDKPIARMAEKSVGRSVMREMLDNELPQQLDILAGETLVAELRQKVKMAGYELSVDFSMDVAHILDRRLGIAAAIFAACHQGSTD